MMWPATGLSAAVDTFAKALQAQLPDVPVVPHPVGTLPGLPCVMIVTRDPTISAGDWCRWELALAVLVFTHRANETEGLAHSLDVTVPVEAAVVEAGGIFDIADSTIVGSVHPVILSGVEYTVADFPVTLFVQ